MYSNVRCTGKHSFMTGSQYPLARRLRVNQFIPVYSFSCPSRFDDDDGEDSVWISMKGNALLCMITFISTNINDQVY